MKKKLIVKQEEISDCGVCSLLSVIRFYGGNVSLEELRISSLTNNEGVTALNLIQCAIQYGFDAVGRRCDSIPIDNLPCIAHIRINDSLSHFIVIYSIKKNKVCVMDPAYGYREIDINTFNELSSKVYILLKPKGRIEYQHNPHCLDKKIKETIINKKKNIISVLILNYIYLFISIFYSFYISVLIYNFKFVYIILFFILLTSSNLLMYLITNSINKFNNCVSLSLTSNFFNHIFRLPLNYVHIKDSNEIIKRVLDLNSIKDTIVSFIITSITNIIIIIITSIILCLINFHVLPFIVSCLIGYLVLSFISKKINYNLDKVIDSNTTYHNNLIDYISGMNSIKHSTSEKYYNNKIFNDYKNDLNIRYKYDKEVLKSNFLKQSYVLSIEFFLNVYILYNVIHGLLSMSDLFVINYLFQLIINSIVIIGNYIPSILYQRKIIIKVNEFYNVKEEEIKNKHIINNEIRINNLCFSYNNYKNVIESFNLVINKGDKLIIKGESGCGKSTLCKILNKEYLNYKGSIYLGNNNYKDIGVNSIRNMISYSSQNERIFHGTIRDNILMGNEIDFKHFEEIIKICEIERIISKKPYGLDTYLFGGGDELSGGEKQLIFLARSLVLDKSILILDETLSEVNDSVENKILHNLFNKYKNKTIIYVSHKNKKEYFHRTVYV